MIKQSVLSIAALAIVGCATVSLPPEHLASEDASVRGAEELGANNVPDARLHLEQAKDETAQAKQLSLNGDDRAVLMLARAEADAELAVGMAREAAVHGDAAKADADLMAVLARGAQ